MANAPKIIRKSIFTFLKNLHHFASTPSLLLLPFAASTLVSLPLVSSSDLFRVVHGRLRSLFLAAGIPPQSELFPILNLKLSQTILSSLFIFPFTISFLLLAKASILKALHHHKPTHKTTFIRLLITQLCNLVLVVSANATCFCLLVVSFNISDVLGLSSRRFLLFMSATGTITYSIILANAYIICSLSLVISATENLSGLDSILKACVLIRGRTSTALSLAVPLNMGLAAIEALFQYRVVRPYHQAMASNSYMYLEAMLIAYMYAILLVLDTILGYVLLKSCKTQHQIEIQERDERSLRKA